MEQVYLHGLGQTPASWEKVTSRPALAKHSLCPDLAQLLQGKEATYQNLYAAVSALCSRCDGTINLCGLSLGGVLALQYSIEHPQKVNSLVLIAPQYHMPKALLRVQNLLFRFLPSSAFPQGGLHKEQLIRLCATMGELDFRGSLSEITCPTLVLCGQRDTANQKAARELAALVKDAQLHIIPGAGHEVNLDAPEKLSELLCHFYGQAS